MAVYVDDFQGRLGRMIMCHMMADTEEELDKMARGLGLRPEWKQRGSRVHYDLSKSKKVMAVQLGAVPVTTRELVQRFHRRAG